jgi:hypothetical protein
MLLCGNFRAAPGEPPPVLVGELCAFGKRVGRLPQCQSHALCGLARVTCSALSVALAVGELALGRGLLPATSGLLAQLSLLEPAEARSLSLRRALLSDLLTLISYTVALIRDPFTVVGSSLSLVRDPVALVRDPVALVRDPVALVRDPVALVRDPVALICGLLTRVHYPLALGGDPCDHLRLSLLLTSLTFPAQPCTFTLQDLVVGLEQRRASLNLRAEANDLDPCNIIALVARSGAQLPQTGALLFECCRPTL